MPLGKSVTSVIKCSKCDSLNSEIWHKTGEEGQELLCSECKRKSFTESVSKLEKKLPVGNLPVKNEKEINSEELDVDDSINFDCQDDFKPDQGTSTRSGNFSVNLRGGFKKSTRGRNRKIGSTKITISKGRGRRSVLKKQPTKACGSSNVMVHNYLFYESTLFQVGDIVSVMDTDGTVYYAQIRGLIQSVYCEKSAVLTWLIPTLQSPPPENGFDPFTYILGPEEELPRKLEFCEFVMHAPSEYFKMSENVQINQKHEERGFIWTSMGPVRRVIQS